MRTNTVGRVTAALVALEGVGLLALVAWQIAAIVTGDTVSLQTAIALIVLTGAGAVIVLVFAVAIWRGRSWGRSGGIVAQILILAVAAGAATGAYAEPGIALMLAAPALLILVLLVLVVREGGREPRDEASV